MSILLLYKNMLRQDVHILKYEIQKKPGYVIHISDKIVQRMPYQYVCVLETTRTANILFFIKCGCDVSTPCQNAKCSF